MSEKDKWCWDISTGQMGFKAPNEKPENYSVMGNFNGMNVEFVPKSKMIEQMDKKQQAEEVRDIFIEFVKDAIKDNALASDCSHYDHRERAKTLLNRYAHYTQKVCMHMNTAIEAQKPKEDSPMLNSFRVRTEEYRLVCLDCGLTQQVQMSFGAVTVKSES